MSLNKEMRTNLAKELREAAKLMAKENDLSRKLYYFSATFGYTNRVLNLAYDPELHLIDGVLSNSFRMLNDRAAAIASGDRVISQVPDEITNALAKSVTELAGRIESAKPSYDILEEIWKTAYAMTGNGFYLWQRGVFTI